MQREPGRRLSAISLGTAAQLAVVVVAVAIVPLRFGSVRTGMAIFIGYCAVVPLALTAGLWLATKEDRPATPEAWASELGARYVAFFLLAASFYLLGYFLL